jgi:hypothetical protein
MEEEENQDEKIKPLERKEVEIGLSEKSNLLKQNEK